MILMCRGNSMNFLALRIEDEGGRDYGLVISRFDLGE